MVWTLKRKKDNVSSIVTVKCDEHQDLVSRLARIEGENIVIITMLTVVVAFILTKVL